MIQEILVWGLFIAIIGFWVLKIIPHKRTSKKNGMGCDACHKD